MFGIDDALLAAIASGAAEAAAPAAEGAAGATGAAGALGPGLDMAGVGLNEALGPGPLGGVGQFANLADTAIPDMTSVPSTLPGPAPYSPSTPVGTPNPMDWPKHLKTANGVLNMAGKLIGNKKDKQTLNLMSLGTALGASGGDLSSPESMAMVQGPLTDIAKSTQEESNQKLNAALGPTTPTSAPSTTANPPAAAPASSAAPATARGTGPLPPLHLMPDTTMLTPQQRLAMLGMH